MSDPPPAPNPAPAPASPRPSRWSALLDKRALSPSAPGSNTGSASAPGSAGPQSPALKSPRVVLGICAMDVKARSKAMREIITRLVDIEKGGVEVKIFGDVVILEEDISHWPPVDVLISFFSTDFPLPKALAYTQIAHRPPPISINSLAMQSLLWDRRLVLAILDHIGVPTPARAEISRDGGPFVPRQLRRRVRRDLGLVLPGPRARDEEQWGEVVMPERWRGKQSGREVPRANEVILREDGDAIIVDGRVIEKPFVEKPVDGEDHNVHIYYRGGGGRRLFRKVGNKSSDYDPDMYHPRTIGSFIYEEFINVDNAEDIKVYTVGPTYSHAETRKSPVVDGLVRRNADGKETRFITKLSPAEEQYATDVVVAFGQRVCGFDLLRCEGGERSMVIDVNGWSFVKGNQAYYDKAAEILSDVCQTARERKAANLLMPHPSASPTDATASMSTTSTLRATVTVLRHADRTPKMKLKFSFPAHDAWSQPFLRLLRGHREEIILRDPRQLQFIISAAAEAALTPGISAENVGKLEQLKEALGKKMGLPGTKAQLKPSFEKKEKAGKDKDKDKDKKKAKEGAKKDKDKAKGKGDGSGDEDEMNEAERAAKVQEWLERTPSANAEGEMVDADKQAGEGLIPEGLEKMQLVLKWGGESTHSARYQARDLGDAFKKDIMIMNKDVLQNVKVYTSSERRVINTAQVFAHALLGVEPGGSSAPSPAAPGPGPGRQTAPEPSPLISHLIQRRDLLDDNNAGKEKMTEAKKMLKILLRTGETEKRPDLAWERGFKKEPVEVVAEVIAQLTELRAIMRRNYENGNVEKIPQQRWCCGDSPWLFRERWEKIFEDWVGVKQEKFDPSRVSELYDSIKYDSLHNRTFLFAIFDPLGKGPQPLKPGSLAVPSSGGVPGSSPTSSSFLTGSAGSAGTGSGGGGSGSGTGTPSATGGGGDAVPKQDRRLHDLYARAKALFDLVSPQEYGFDQEAKEEIGILTSLPLLRKIWEDLEEARTTGKSLACFYFTKESHITTFFNLLVLSGIPIAGSGKNVPELDYCSHCTIELWEKSSGPGSGSGSGAGGEAGKKEYSLRLSVSEGAHSPAVLDSNVDARHSLTVQPRKKLTGHLDYDFARQCFSKHFGKGLSFSTTPLEGDEVYLKKAVYDESVLPLNLQRLAAGASVNGSVAGAAPGAGAGAGMMSSASSEASGYEGRAGW